MHTFQDGGVGRMLSIMIIQGNNPEREAGLGSKLESYTYNIMFIL